VFRHFIINVHTETLIWEADGYFIGDTKIYTNKDLSHQSGSCEKYLVDAYFSELQG